MDIQKITQLCNHIIAAANGVEHKGEENSTQILVICRAARQIAAEVNNKEKIDEGYA